MRTLALEARPVVLAAPSGTGKTTIARALVETEPDFAFSVSATTRAPRESEVHGVDYWFLSRSEFLRMVEEGEFAEWAEVHGDLYGTPRKSLVEAGMGGRHVVLDIDVQGAAQIRETVPEALLLFILPPTVESLFQRLVGRGTEGEEALRRRLRTALEELKAAEGFDVFVVNDELSSAVREVRDLVREGRTGPGGASATARDARKLMDGVRAILSRQKLLADEQQNLMTDE